MVSTNSSLLCVMMCSVFPPRALFYYFFCILFLLHFSPIFSFFDVSGGIAMIFNVVVVQGLMNIFDKFREFVKEQHPKELMTTVEFLALRYSYFSHSPQSITLAL